MYSNHRRAVLSFSRQAYAVAFVWQLGGRRHNMEANAVDGQVPGLPTRIATKFYTVAKTVHAQGRPGGYRANEADGANGAIQHRSHQKEARLQSIA